MSNTFQVTFKTPDALENAAMEFGEQQASLLCDGGKDEDWEDVKENWQNEALAFARKWVKYDEYITVEFDTVAGTCKVLEK